MAGDELLETPGDNDDTDDTDATAQAIVDEAFGGLTDDDVADEGAGAEDTVDTGGEALDDDPTETVDDEEAGKAGEGESGQPRSKDGRFTEKAKDAPKDTPKDTTPAAGTAGTAGTADASKPEAAASVPSAPAPQPETLRVRVDKADVEIKEARIVRANGNAFIAINEADLPQFLGRVQRGVVAERMWRQLHEAQREMETRKAEPQAKTDAEVEAELTLEAVKPHLAEILTAEQLDNLELKIKLAQRDAKDEHAKALTTHREKVAAAEREANAAGEEETQVYHALAGEMKELIDQHPEIAEKLTPEQAQAVYRELVPLHRSIFWKDSKGQWFKNNQLVLDRLRQAASGVAPTGSHTAPPAGSPKGPDAVPAAGTPKKPDANDRFNRGVTSAAQPKPTSTSVKATRGAAAPTRPRDERHHRAAKDTRSAAMIAEDQSRASNRAFLSSPGLDFPDDEEDA